jgi:hypothetical protein
MGLFWPQEVLQFRAARNDEQTIPDLRNPEVVWREARMFYFVANSLKIALNLLPRATAIMPL